MYRYREQNCYGVYKAIDLTLKHLSYIIDCTFNIRPWVYSFGPSPIHG